MSKGTEFGVTAEEFIERADALAKALRDNQPIAAEIVATLIEQADQLRKKKRGLLNLQRLWFEDKKIPLYRSRPLVNELATEPGIFSGCAFELHTDFSWSLERDPAHPDKVYLVPRANDKLDPNPID